MCRGRGLEEEDEGGGHSFCNHSLKEPQAGSSGHSSRPKAPQTPGQDTADGSLSIQETSPGWTGCGQVWKV